MLSEFLKFFDIWNEKKKEVVQNKKIIQIKERDIVFLNMGHNVGFEQDGKGGEFLRPAIVYKKFNKNQFLGIPLTSKHKESLFYYPFEFVSKTDGKRENSAILSQIKAFDTKRVKFKLGVIDKENFEKLHIKLLEAIKPDEVASKEAKSSNTPKGESPEGIYAESVPKSKEDVKS